MKKKRKWVWKLAGIFLALLFLFPLLAFGISNLFLISPKGKTWLSKKIEHRIQLESTVDGASWSPWNGITIYGLLIRQPAPLKNSVSKPLLTTSEIRILPGWKALTKKQLHIREMDISSPELVLPIELLSALPRTEVPPPAIASNEPPPVAKNNTAPPPAAAGGIVTPQNPPQNPPTTIKKLPTKPRPPVWLNVTGGKFSIVSTFTEKKLLSIPLVEGRLPIGGNKVSSYLTLREITCYDKKIQTELAIPVSLNNSILRFGTMKTKLLDFDCEAVASFSMSPGIPFEILSKIPTRKDHEIRFSEFGRFHLGTAAAQGRFQGLLFAPATWQGRWMAEATDISGKITENQVNFSHGRAAIVYQNGALSCVDARLLGESVSILGNATLLRDGRTAGIARVVAPHDTLISISNFTHKGETPSLTPLRTSQRSALDLQIFGKIGELYFLPHPSARPIPLNN